MKNLGTIKRDRLTLDEHKELASELRSMSNRLAEIQKELYNRGYRNDAIQDAYVAHRKARLLISSLEDICAIENPSEFMTSIYYPMGGLTIL